MLKSKGHFLLLAIVTVIVIACQPNTSKEVRHWENRADRVTIIRDDFGIPHIYAPSDADAVFGMLFAQAEDDFRRIERNYIWATGRLAELEGPTALYSDLRANMYMTEAEARAAYDSAPKWLQELCIAFADGLNYYLHTHPHVTPQVITRYEPWMPMFFSEGSIGGDIERINTRRIQSFYETHVLATENGTDQASAHVWNGQDLVNNQDLWNDRGPLNGTQLSEQSITQRLSYPRTEPVSDKKRLDSMNFAHVPTSNTEPVIDMEPRGSNGFAIAPEKSATGNALLLINPHTSFYFRPEIHVVSDEGLNVYGAVTWGQFFVYQGFNEKTGWMHTSTYVDFIDEFILDVTKTDNGIQYRYGEEQRDVEIHSVTLRYKHEETGSVNDTTFTFYRTHQGPITHAIDEKWVTTRINWDPVNALIQSYTRTKLNNYDEFREMMDIRTNSSNNTVFADAEGNIAYFHGNFIPKRNPEFDFSNPVDGSNPATDWLGIHTVDESIVIHNPETGWIQNTNSTPFTAADQFSPNPKDYPRYMAPDPENFRGLHAVRVLRNAQDITLDKLIELAYDPYLPGFEAMVPVLLQAYDRVGSRYPELREPIRVLRAWDYTTSTESVAMSLAHFYGIEFARGVGNPENMIPFNQQVLGRSWQQPDPEKVVKAFADAIEKLNDDFGTWNTPWGEINRFQRLSGDIDLQFDDEQESIAIGMASGRWGALASYGSGARPNTKKLYGTSGNSFVAVVEFGERVRAKSILAGGQNSDPTSPHFYDQAQRYADVAFKDIAFYREDVEARARETYRPGKRH